MTGQPVCHLDTPLARGMCQLFQKMVDRLMLELNIRDAVALAREVEASR